MEVMCLQHLLIEYLEEKQENILLNTLFTVRKLSSLSSQDKLSLSKCW